MRGRLTIIVLAGIAVVIAFVVSGRGDSKPNPKASSAGAAAQAPAGAPRGHARLLAREGEAARAADQALQRRAARERRAGRLRRRAANMASGDAETKIAKGTLQPAPGRRRRRSGAGCSTTRPTSALVADENPSIVRTPLVIAMWEPMARGARLPAAAARLRGSSARSPTGGWAAFGQPEFGALQARPHQPGLLDLRAVRGRRRVLRGDGQEGGADRGRRRRRGARRRCGTSSARSSTTATRRCSSPTRCAGAGSGYASAVAMEETTLIDFNRRAGDGAQARRDLSEGGHVLLRQPVDHARGRLGDAPSSSAAAQGVRSVPRQGDHARGRGRAGLPARRPRRRARRARRGRERRRPRAARARAAACPSRRCSRKIRRPGARTASRPT